MSQVRTRKRGKTFSYIFEAGKKADGKRKVVEKAALRLKKQHVTQEFPPMTIGSTAISESPTKNQHQILYAKLA